MDSIITDGLYFPLNVSVSVTIEGPPVAAAAETTPPAITPPRIVSIEDTSS